MMALQAVATLRWPRNPELIVPMDEGDDLPESARALEEQVSQYLTHAAGGQSRSITCRQ